MAFSKMQREFFDNANHRWNIKTGATRSGKTYMDYFVIPMRIRKRIGKDGLVVILGVTKETIERNILEPMRNKYGSELVGGIDNRNRCYLFGESCYCLGAEKVSQVSKIRGSSIKYCYGDEIADWNPEVFQLIKSRLDKSYSCFDGALNPQSPNHWLKEFLESDADIYQQKYTIFDNPFLDKEFVDNLCKEYENTVYYKRYILGEWALAEGVIYDMFSEERHCVSEETLLKALNGASGRYVSVDYGTQNATVFLMWEKGTDGVWYCSKEYHYSGRDKGKQKTDEMYTDDMAEFTKDKPPRAIIVDPSASSFIASLRNRGFSVIKADNDVDNGIRNVSRVLNQNKIKFNKDRCAETIKEFGGYVWDEKKVEAGIDAPIKVNDHCMDAMRYFVQTIMFKQKANVKSKARVI